SDLVSVDRPRRPLDRPSGTDSEPIPEPGDPAKADSRRAEMLGADPRDDAQVRLRVRSRLWAIQPPISVANTAQVAGSGVATGSKVSPSGTRSRSCGVAESPSPACTRIRPWLSS